MALTIVFFTMFVGVALAVTVACLCFIEVAFKCADSIDRSSYEPVFAKQSESLSLASRSGLARVHQCA